MNKRTIELLADLLLECENRYICEHPDNFKSYKKMHKYFIDLGLLTELEYQQILKERASHSHIFFVSLNIDSDVVTWDFDTVEEIEEEWWSDECSLPANDDLIIYAAYDGKKIKCNDFEDMLAALGVSGALE